VSALFAGSPYSDREPFAERRGQLAQPVQGQIAVPFGPEPIARLATLVRHPGLTFDVQPGSEVRSVARGIVCFAGEFYGYDEVVIVDHGGAYHSVYAHLGEVSVQVGELVEARQRLGRTATGAASGLYFELRQRGDPLDPADWFAPSPSP